MVTVATAAKQETAVQEDKPTVEIHLGPPMQEKAVLLTGVMAAILMGVEAVQQLAARAVAEAMEELQMGDMEVTERCTDSVSGIFVLGDAGGKGGDGGTGGKGGISDGGERRHWWSRG